MMLLLFLGMLLFLFSGSFAVTLWSGEKPERVWLPILFGNALLLYVAISFHIGNLGFALIYAANLLALIFSIGRKFFRKEAIVWKELFTPGTIFLLVGLTATFWLNLYPFFAGWDTISHWGTYSKLLLQEGKLSCEYPQGILLHASYPPGQAILSFLVHKCFFSLPFEERIVLFAHDLVMWGVFARLFDRCKHGEWQKTLLLGGALLGAALPMASYYVYSAGYSDCALAMLFAVAMYDVAETPFDKPWRFLQLAVNIAFLFMIRNAGWGYAVGLLILYIFRVVQNFRVATDSPLKKSALAAMILLPVIVKISWTVQLKIYHTALRFGGNHITFAALRDLIVNRTPEFLATLKLFGIQLVSGYIETLLLILLVLFWLAKLCKTREKLQSAKMLIFFNLASFILFCVTLFIYYVFEFHEKTNFPSLCRYCSSFLYSPLVVLLFFLGDIPIRKTSEGKYKGLLFLCAVAVSLGVYLPFHSFQVDNCYRWRQENEKIARFDTLLLAPGKHYTSIGLSGAGFKPFCFTYRTPHHYRRVTETDGECCLKAMPTETIRRAFLREKIDYVYFTDKLPEFAAMHPTLFAPEKFESLEDMLFQVDERGNLRRVAETMTR